MDADDSHPGAGFALDITAQNIDIASGFSNDIIVILFTNSGDAQHQSIKLFYYSGCVQDDA